MGLDLGDHNLYLHVVDLAFLLHHLFGLTDENGRKQKHQRNGIQNLKHGYPIEKRLPDDRTQGHEQIDIQRDQLSLFEAFTVAYQHPPF